MPKKPETRSATRTSDRILLASFRICYTADGEFVIGGGNSKNLCIYDIRHRLMTKRITLTNNRSLDGVLAQLNSKNIINGVDTTIVDTESEPSDWEDRKDDILPGVQAGKHSKRKNLYRVQTRQVVLSNTGRMCAIATTEGFSVYTMGDFLNNSAGRYSAAVSKKDILLMASKSDFVGLLLAAINLRDKKLLTMIFKKTPVDQIDILVQNLPSESIIPMISFLADLIESDQIVEEMMFWMKPLLMYHWNMLESTTLDANAAVKDLLKGFKRRVDKINEVSLEAKYYSDYISKQAEIRAAQRASKMLLEEANPRPKSDSRNHKTASSSQDKTKKPKNT